MTKTVGFLEKTKSDKTDAEGFIGEVELDGATGPIAFIPVGEKRTPASPDFRVALTRGGRWVDWGAGWWKQANNGGEPYLSFILDHESMDKALYPVAFPPMEDEDGDQWSIVWSRPKQKGGKASQNAPVKSEPLADEIPF